MGFSKVAVLVLSISLLAASVAAVRDDSPKRQVPPQAADVHETSYIDANNILMFITNHGSYARDLGSVFGYDLGSFYPYQSIADIQGGTLIKSCLWAGGIWIGGQVAGETRVTVSEFSSEYVPGPMSAGTFQTDRPEFKVYKLYRDSLADNPNADFLNWPIGQGSPIAPDSTPLRIGDQFLWTVFNDADPNQHDNDAGSTVPLGIEVQLSAWAFDQPSGDDTLYLYSRIPITEDTLQDFSVTIHVPDPTLLNDHDYRVIIEPVGENYVWHLEDVTTGTMLLLNQSDFSETSYSFHSVDNMEIAVSHFVGYAITRFEVVANAGGVLNPPEGGAFDFGGFPSERPTDRQQVGPAIWGIHTGGNWPSYSDFLMRTFRDDTARVNRMGEYDYEVRFTGAYNTPGSGGSYAFEFASTHTSYWIPLELWRTGKGTPDDPTDDVRLIPYIFGDGDQVYGLTAYGSAPVCGPGGCDHPVSGLDDDPYTGDWIYWYLPSDTTPGEAGYLQFEQAMVSDPLSYVGNEQPLMDRMVFVSWNGGSAPPFAQELPEQGTVFRISTYKQTPLSGPADITFTASLPTDHVVTGGESNALYLKYLLINKGSNTIDNTYLSFWHDPDLGGAGDDLVGCDSTDDVWYCYNGSTDDALYGYRVPSIGFKLLAGPVISSPGDTAMFNGFPRPNYRNLPMNAFVGMFNGIDPNDFLESYNYMQGLSADGNTYSYNGTATTYWHSGDPVTGLGDLDMLPADRRMMASSGPFTFAPNDTQQVVLKIAIGQGTSALNSVTKLRELLATSHDYCCIGMRGNINGSTGDVIDIVDLTYLVEYMFKSGPPPPCMSEVDVNDYPETVDILDLTYLVDYMFRNGPPPTPCP